jgi:leader peptidase (prepilin peptidase) / N-methyltransferase
VIGLGLAVGAVAGWAVPAVARRFGVHCGRWPWVLIGAVTGGGLGWRFAAAVLAAWLVVLAAGLPLAAIDLAVHRLPDALVLPAWVAVAALAVAAGELRALSGGLALVAAFAVLAVLPRSALGFGDVKLCGGLGTALALISWRALIVGVLLAFVFGGVVALALLLSGRVRRDTAIPFGPALIAGALVAALTA